MCIRDSDYKKISAPTRMQYARYRDGLSRVMSTGYGKAREYLQKVISQFPSTEAQKTLERIKLIEKEVNRYLCASFSICCYRAVRMGKSIGPSTTERVCVCPCLGPGISGLYVRT